MHGHYSEAGSLFAVLGGRVSGAHRGRVFENRKTFGELESIGAQLMDRSATVKLNGKNMNEGHDIEPTEGSYG